MQTRSAHPTPVTLDVRMMGTACMVCILDATSSMSASAVTNVGSNSTPGDCTCVRGCAWVCAAMGMGSRAHYPSKVQAGEAGEAGQTDPRGRQAQGAP
jgi:hypothetical protein